MQWEKIPQSVHQMQLHSKLTEHKKMNINNQLTKKKQFFPVQRIQLNPKCANKFK